MTIVKKCSRLNLNIQQTKYRDENIDHTVIFMLMSIATIAIKFHLILMLFHPLLRAIVYFWIFDNSNINNFSLTSLIYTSK